MRKIIICLLFPLLFNYIGCSRSRSVPQNNSPWAEIYHITLKSYLEQDTALNENINFIAIDFSTLDNATDDDKILLRTLFGIKHLPIVDANLEKLQADGLFNEEGMNITDGVLLSILKVTENENEIIIEGRKYRGARGANWFETKWLLNNGVWEFSETVMTMIS